MRHKVWAKFWPLLSFWCVFGFYFLVKSCFAVCAFWWVLVGAFSTGNRLKRVSEQSYCRTVGFFCKGKRTSKWTAEEQLPEDCTQRLYLKGKWSGHAQCSIWCHCRKTLLRRCCTEHAALLLLLLLLLFSLWRSERQEQQSKCVQCNASLPMFWYSGSRLRKAAKTFT